MKYYEKTRTLGKNISINAIKYKDELKDYPDYPLYRYEKMAYVDGKIMTRVGIKAYNVLLTSAKKIPAYEADKKILKINCCN